MKKVWYIAATLFFPWVAARVLTAVGQVLGCNNYFEVGCTPSIGNTFGEIGFFLMLLSVVTVPIGVLVGVYGVIKTIQNRRK